MADGKVIGGPFSSKVIHQLNKRSEVLSKPSRTDADILLLTSRTGWAKLTSGVNVAGQGDKLAREYILIGGQIGLTGADTYSNYYGNSGKGFRPMPGITSVQIRSINQFGSLKEATVTFNCWDRGQLTDLEKLYMRPGFTALLEWGHSVYTKDGVHVDKHVETVKNFFTAGRSKEQIYAEIEELKAGSAHNYDGILGFVKNFSWSFRPDGGYDCTTTVISIGEIMESLTIDVDTPSLTKRNATEGEDAMTLPATMLQDILVDLKKSEQESAWSDIVAKYPTFASKHIKIGGRDKLDIGKMAMTSIKSGDQVDNTSTKTFTYISLRSFCELVNTLIIVDNNSKNVVRLNTDVGNTPFRSFKFHTSSDPNVCVLITDTTKNWSYNETLLADLQARTAGPRNDILNIYINANFLQKQTHNLFINQPKESRTLLNLMQPILAELNLVLGGIHEFGLQYEESEFTYYIVDRKVEVSDGDLESKNSILNITGLKSSVSKFDFTTKLSPALTTMIAISAQNNGADVGIEADALLRWNEGLSDRIIKKKSVQTPNTPTEDTVNTDEQQQQRRDTINKALNAVYNNLQQYDREAINLARSQNEQHSTEYVQNHQTQGNNAGPAGIIPFEVGIEMDGISGIKIGQAFKINKGIMPAKYDDVVGFIVTGIDHTISGNRWVTNLKAQTIILKSATGKKKDAEYKEDENPDPKKKAFKGSGVCTEPYKNTNLNKGWEGKQVAFTRTRVDPAVEGPKLVAKYGKTLAQAILTTMQIEQGYKGFNWNLGGFDITSGGWVFNPKLHNGYVVAKEGGTGLCKAFVSFISFETFIEQKVASFKRKGFEKGSTAESFAKIWYEKWNGFGARTVNPNNLTVAQLDANAKSFAAGLWKKNAKYV